MWQRFTERARRMVFYAQEEARRLDQNYVGTEHILLGMLREQDHVAARVLEGLGVSLGKIREEVERQAERGTGKTGQNLELTPRGKRSIDLAYEEAKLLHNNYIGTEHLLLGLIRESEGVAGRVLAEQGVQLEPVREAIRVLQQSGSQSPATPNPLDVQQEESGPQPGDLGRAQAPSNGGQLVLAISEDAYQELREIVAIKDDYAYYELVKTDKVFPAAPVNVKLLKKGRSGGYLVRLLEGEPAGKTGWLAPEQFERTGPDERPFPPLPASPSAREESALQESPPASETTAPPEA
ncbi:MAG TPA: Clp protease N-terminal domain-containing protein [Chthonomonadaceae bacterium]|nr:Clp protease N-terminal domain-containing protein [Chthonomonadaceae bacterium]